jgi:hypothetical protein
LHDGTHRELDHVFVSTPSPVIIARFQHATLPHAGLSDHTPLLTTLVLDHFPYRPPQQHTTKPPSPRIAYPIKKGNLQAFRKKTSALLGTDIQAFADVVHNTSAALCSLWDTHKDFTLIHASLVDPAGPNHWIIAAHEEACLKLDALTMEIGVVATECLETYTPGPHNGQQNQYYMSKPAKRQLQQCLLDCKYLNSIISATKLSLANIRNTHISHIAPNTSDTNIPTWLADLHLHISTMHDVHKVARHRLLQAGNIPAAPALPTPTTELVMMTPNGEDPKAFLLSWLQPYIDTHKMLRTQMWKLKNEQRQLSYRKYCKRWRKVLATQPKKTYKRIFQQRRSVAPPNLDEDPNTTLRFDGQVPTDMSVVKDPSIGGVPTSNPESVLNAVFDFFSKQQAPASGARHGRYGDDDTLRNYPFAADCATDRFVLQPHQPLARTNSEIEMTNELIHGGRPHDGGAQTCSQEQGTRPGWHT